MNSGALLGEVRVEVGDLEALGIVENLHDEGDRGDVNHVGGFGGTGTASKDATDALEDIGDARTGVPSGGERAQVLVRGNDRPLPRLLILASKVVAGVRGNVTRLADCGTRLGAIFKNDQVQLAVGVEHGRANEGALGDLVSERHETVDREFEGGRAADRPCP